MAETATEPKTIPPAIFQKRAGSNEVQMPLQSLIKKKNQNMKQNLMGQEHIMLLVKDLCLHRILSLVVILKSHHHSDDDFASLFWVFME